MSRMSGTPLADEKLPRRPVTIVVRPVDERCNLSCTYCNAQPYDGRGVMEDATLFTLIEQSGAARGLDIDFCWHGGEPLLVGKQFFERAFAYQDLHFDERSKPHNIIQTNGLLLNNELLDLFQSREVNLGFSLDGPDVEANRYRFPRGAAARILDQTLAAMERVRSRGLRLTVIMVVHEANVRRPSHVYEFFRDLGVETLSFNPRFLGSSRPGSEENLSPESYAGFLSEMVRLRDAGVASGDRPLGLGTADQFGRLKSGKPASLCFLTDKCHQFINVNQRGEVYATCSDFIGVGMGTLESPGLTYILEKLTLGTIRNVELKLGSRAEIEVRGQAVSPGCPKYSQGDGDVYIHALADSLAR